MLENYKKIINFTPTGTQTTKQNSFAPLEPNEIIEDVISANEIGITLVHLHARDESHHNTYKVEYYQKIIEGIRRYCPELIICTSLTGRNFPEIEKRTEVLQLKPDLASLTLSSINFPSGASINQPDVIYQLIEKMNEFGVIPELECFDTGMINMAKFLINKQILKPPFYFNVILGNLYNSQSDLSSIADIKSQIPNNSLTTIGGIGNQQLKSNIYGLLDFNGIRIGLEDNFYYRNKEKTTNKDLLLRIHRILNELDFKVVEPTELRQLGYENKHTNNR